jgi:hypothetical protein
MNRYQNPLPQENSHSEEGTLMQSASDHEKRRQRVIKTLRGSLTNHIADMVEARMYDTRIYCPRQTLTFVVETTLDIMADLFAIYEDEPEADSEIPGAH